MYNNDKDDDKEDDNDVDMKADHDNNDDDDDAAIIKMVTALDTINHIHLPNIQSHININNREQWKKQRHISMNPNADCSYNEVQRLFKNIKAHQPQHYKQVTLNPRYTEWLQRVENQASPIELPLKKRGDVFVPLCLMDEKQIEANNERKRKSSDNNHDEPPKKRQKTTTETTTSLNGMCYI